jgi:DNA-binding beta-propeller fold protein YncE
LQVKRTLITAVAVAACLASADISWSARLSPSTRSDAKERLRRPNALALTQADHFLFVANESGSVSIIDTQSFQVLAEVDVGRKLSDLGALPDGKRLVAVDQEANELILLWHQGPALQVIQRTPVGPDPVQVRVTKDGTLACVTSRWSWQVTLLDLAPVVRVRASIPVPFAPREELLVAGDKKLVVADAFGGRVAVVDLGRGKVESVRSVPGHNIRGLALGRDGRQVLLAHQILHSLAHTTFDDVHWGNLMTNNLRLLALDAVLNPKADLLQGGRLLYLGEVGNAAGDPNQVTVARDGSVLVALGGVGDVAISRGDAGYQWQRVAAGRRPVAVITASDGRHGYVANHLSDSVSILDLRAARLVKEIPLGPTPALQASQRGESLFFDARLAHDGWLSCHSCHSDGHSNGLLNDNLGDGSFGAPKRVLSLLGVGDTAPYAWLGIMPDLESQVRKSILTTMHGSRPSDQQVADLAAYLRTLGPPPSRARLLRHHDVTSIERGREVFNKQACSHCHAPPEYTSKKTFDVGLRDEVGNTQFNPPSLRGASQGGPYFHDGRAATLAEVFTRFRHQLKTSVSNQELDDLLHFLGSL